MYDKSSESTIFYSLFFAKGSWPYKIYFGQEYILEDGIFFILITIF